MAKDKILVVDDVVINRNILVEMLKNDYDILEAKNGLEAIEAVKNNARDISLILLDIIMPKMDGFEVIKVLHSLGYSKIPIIIITSSGGYENEVKGLSLGAVDYINKPFYSQSVLARVNLQIELSKHRLHLEELVEKNIRKFISTRDQLIDFLAFIIEYRNVESALHIKRTRLMAEYLFNKIEQSHKMDQEVFSVNKSAILTAVSLHDIGKIGIPDRILLKHGSLTDEEFSIIKEHVVIGANIIKHLEDIEDNELIQACHDICLYHHERWDGKGYPEGRSGKNIPFSARLMTMIDIYDALTSKRAYKNPYSHEEAIGILKKEKTRFDPAMFDIFIENHEGFNALSKQIKEKKKSDK
ncbi:MAG: response regulator [Endomicrobia bacterium]|nr:response regulator [Endomicrobiia bacterium]MCL2799626.1 response regulator [Endomicrobiia bacterium]